MNRRNLWLGSVSWLMVLFQLALAGCGEEAMSRAQVSLKGRVYSADDGKALRGVSLGLGNEETESDDGGEFELSYGQTKEAVVTATSAMHASTSKRAPEQGGYVE